MEIQLFPEFPILVVDDEKHFLNSMDFELRSKGFVNVECCLDSREVMPKLQEKKYSVILLDILMPHICGDELLPQIVDKYPETPVIIITAFPDAKTARDCMTKGAFDCLTKPLEIMELIRTIQETLDLRDIHKEIIQHKKQLFSNVSGKSRIFPNVISRSEKMDATSRAIALVSFTTRSVLVMGEKGVGKEFLSREIHKQSHRKGKFISFDTTGLNDVIFSGLLFGYKRIISPGGGEIIEGKLDEARCGTLLLSGIGDLTLESQAKLLRLLQSREYYPQESNKLKYSDVRIIAATDTNLPALVQTGAFRQDLYNHLKAHEIHIPPLRERKEDIPLLLGHFLGKAAISAGIQKPVVPVYLLPLLKKYNFPGNVGELKKMVNQAVSRCKSGFLSVDDFFMDTKEKEHQIPKY